MPTIKTVTHSVTQVQTDLSRLLSTASRLASFRERLRLPRLASDSYSSPRADVTPALEAWLDDIQQRAMVDAVNDSQDAPAIIGPACRKDVRRRLLDIRDNREPYTSVRKLTERLCAEGLQCGKSTVQKAFEESSGLQKWRAKRIIPAAAPRATSLTDLHSDNTIQSREPDPSIAGDSDAEIMDRLIEQASPEGKDKLRRLPDDQRQQMADHYRKHGMPEEDYKLLDRRP